MIDFDIPVCHPDIAVLAPAYRMIVVHAPTVSPYMHLGKSYPRLALRYGLSDMSGAYMRLIHLDRVAPVTSPSLVRGIDLPMTSRQIANLPLAAVEGQERYWRQGFDAAGKIDQRNVKWSTHQHRGLALDFALAGNAVALADIPLIRNELENGSLVCLSETEITLDRGIHLAEPLGPFSDARISAFGDWLTEHVASLKPGV